MNWLLSVTLAVSGVTYDLPMPTQAKCEALARTINTDRRYHAECKEQGK